MFAIVTSQKQMGLPSTIQDYANKGTCVTPSSLSGGSSSGTPVVKNENAFLQIVLDIAQKPAADIDTELH